MKLTPAVLVAIAMAGVWQTASATTQRIVTVNGAKLTPAQIAWFDRAQCAFIPNGSYWWNPQGGAWGYAGNPRVQGVIGEACRSKSHHSQRAPHKSLSQRGLLYTPGDLNFR